MSWVVSQMTQYITSLDWSYIITFILLAYGTNQPKVRGFFYKVFRFRLKTRYRTLIVGVIYGVILFFIRGKDTRQIEELFKALLFAMIFHKLMIDQIVNFFSGGFRKLSGDKSISEVHDYDKEL